jgi:hypothetical protein
MMHPKHLGKKEVRYEFSVHIVVQKLLPTVSLVEVTWKQTGKKHGVQGSTNHMPSISCVSRTKAARSVQLNLFKDRRGSVDSKVLTFEVCRSRARPVKYPAIRKRAREAGGR